MALDDRDEVLRFRVSLAVLERHDSGSFARTGRPFYAPPEASRQAFPPSAGSEAPRRARCHSTPRNPGPRGARRHGVAERRVRQARSQLDLEVEVSTFDACRSKRPHRTIRIHYKRIFEVVEDVAANQEHKLVEALADRIAAGGAVEVRRRIASRSRFASRRRSAGVLAVRRRAHHAFARRPLNCLTDRPQGRTHGGEARTELGGRTTERYVVLCSPRGTPLRARSPPTVQQPAPIQNPSPIELESPMASEKPIAPRQRETWRLQMSNNERLKVCERGAVLRRSPRRANAHTFLDEVDALDRGEKQDDFGDAKELSKFFGIYKQQARGERGRKTDDQFFMVRHQGAGWRRLQPGPVACSRSRRGRIRRRHPAGHVAPGDPISPRLRPEARAADSPPEPQLPRGRDARCLRRRQPQRDGFAGRGSRSGSMRPGAFELAHEIADELAPRSVGLLPDLPVRRRGSQRPGR